MVFTTSLDASFWGNPLPCWMWCIIGVALFFIVIFGYLQSGIKAEDKIAYEEYLQKKKNGEIGNIPFEEYWDIEEHKKY